MKTSNNNQPTQEFKVVKLWEGFPSKNSTIANGSYEEMRDELESWKSTSRRNGADIVSEDEDHYTCENYGSHGETVTFQIVEA